MAGGDTPATMGSIGLAIRHIASKIKPPAPDIGTSQAPEIGPDKSGLFGTPAPEEY
jgi:hypothetical protein